MTGPTDPKRSTEAERKRLLEEFSAAQRERNEEWETRRRHDGRAARATRLVVALVLGAVLTWLLVAPPPWVHPPVAEPVPPAVTEAGLRLAMFIQAQQIERYRRTQGRLPETLDDTGEPVQGLRYTTVGQDGWELSGGPPGSEIRLQSGDALDAFLGNSMTALQPERSR